MQKRLPFFLLRTRFFRPNWTILISQTIALMMMMTVHPRHLQDHNRQNQMKRTVPEAWNLFQIALHWIQDWEGWSRLINANSRRRKRGRWQKKKETKGERGSSKWSEKEKSRRTNNNRGSGHDERSKTSCEQSSLLELNIARRTHDSCGIGKSIILLEQGSNYTFLWNVTCTVFLRKFCEKPQFKTHAT